MDYYFWKIVKSKVLKIVWLRSRSTGKRRKRWRKRRLGELPRLPITNLYIQKFKQLNSVWTKRFLVVTTLLQGLLALNLKVFLKTVNYTYSSQWTLFSYNIEKYYILFSKKSRFAKKYVINLAHTLSQTSPRQQIQNLVKFKKFHAGFQVLDNLAEPMAARLFRRLRGSAKAHHRYSKRVKPPVSRPNNWVESSIKYKTKLLLTKHRKMLIKYLNLRLSRQYRITKKISSFLNTKRARFLFYFDLLLLNILITSRLVIHYTQGLYLINQGFVHVNGCVESNPKTLIQTGSIVQLTFSTVYFDAYVYYYNFCSKYYNKYLNKFFRRRSFDPEHSFRRKFLRASTSTKKSRQFVVSKSLVPKWLEVDFLTASLVILYTPTKIKELNSNNFYYFNFYLKRLYNWKFRS